MPRRPFAPVRFSVLHALSRRWLCAVVTTGLAAAAQAQVDPIQAYADSARHWLDTNVISATGVNGPAGATGAPLRMEVSVGQLDSRLRLAPCGQVEPFLPTGGRLWGKSRIGLRCVDGVTRWSVFLPVTVKAFGPAWVARNPVAAGAALGQDDAIQAEVDWADEASPVLANADAWVGQVAARNWAPGQAIRQSMVKPATVFQAGAQIRVLAEGAGFQVASDGQAMSAGVVGQLARVRMDNGRVMSGTVMDARTVRLAM
ncbi:MAG: flagella basal body P-ring formation protein FlgA [Rhodoferax sp.]|nr:flagella basal body P-ring formation protein FlgA [Rhodoferax sp.]